MFSSDCAFTQSFPHWVSPTAQRAAQRPSEQLCPAAHAVPHTPQFAPSVRGSTQAAPQRTSPSGHAQAPATQRAPPVHAVPQPPQLALSLRGSTHEPPHIVRPDPHETVQTLREQT